MNCPKPAARCGRWKKTSRRTARSGWSLPGSRRPRRPQSPGASILRLSESRPLPASSIEDAGIRVPTPDGDIPADLWRDNLALSDTPPARSCWSERFPQKTPSIHVIGISLAFDWPCLRATFRPKNWASDVHALFHGTLGQLLQSALALEQLHVQYRLQE